MASLLLGSLALGVLAAADDEGFVMPRAYHAKTYPAREEHSNENLTIAADPYDLPDKASIFTVDYAGHGFLPVFFILSNDGDQPVVLTDMKVEFITVHGDKIRPAVPDDIYRRIQRKPGRPDKNPLPIPWPQKSKPRVKSEAQDEVERARFQALAVEPHSTQSGFLFFDVSGLRHPLAGAHLYITGLRDARDNELFFFEIPLEKYLTYQPPGQ